MIIRLFGRVHFAFWETQELGRNVQTDNHWINSVSHPFVLLSLCLYQCMSLCLTVSLSVSRFFGLSFSLSLYLSFSISLCLSLCLTVCLSVFRSLFVSLSLSLPSLFLSVSLSIGLSFTISCFFFFSLIIPDRSNNKFQEVLSTQKYQNSFRTISVLVWVVW